MKKQFFSILLCLALGQTLLGAAEGTVWSAQKAQIWYAKQPWLVGCNFTPSTAINQLEMWQAETFDPETIDRELKLAAGIGMNFVRVYLHDLLWQQDSNGMIHRIDEFLSIADKHRIKVMFVLLDGCWDPHPKLGKQREPKPHVHNSGWVQSPHVEILKSPQRHPELADYVRGILAEYKNDPRVLLWDLYNEPANRNVRSYIQFAPDKIEDLALALCRRVFQWARQVDPSQPLSIGVWQGDWDEGKLSELNRFCLENSDIITFHNYTSFITLKKKTLSLLRYPRPLICTEYMSRPTGNTFFAALPFFKEYRIGAANWGLVAGKTQTQYPWDSWQQEYTAEPDLWFHEIFRNDGRPYDQNETEFIKTLTGADGSL